MTTHLRLGAAVVVTCLLLLPLSLGTAAATPPDTSIPESAPLLYATWERVDGESVWDFRPDGTYTYSGPLGIEEGIYRVTEEDGVTRILILDADDPSGLTATFQYTFEIDGDRLAMTAAGTTIEYQRTSAPEYGVIERDGQIHLVAPPGGVLELTSSDLPPEILAQMVTVGAMHATVAEPGTIVEGDTTVLLDGLPIARLGDGTANGGEIVEGSEVVFVNGVPAAFIGGLVVDPTVAGAFIPRAGGPILASSCAPDAAEPCVPDDYPEPIDPLAEPARAGDDRIVLTDDGDFEIGDTIVIGGDENAEVRVVDDKGSLILDRPLEFDHPAGTVVVRVPDEVAADLSQPDAAPADDVNQPEAAPADDVNQPEAAPASDDAVADANRPEEVAASDGDSRRWVAFGVAVAVAVAAGVLFLIVFRGGRKTPSDQAEESPREDVEVGGPAA